MDSIMELFNNFDSLLGVSAIIVFVTQFLKDKVFDELAGFKAQLLSWFVGIAASFIGVFLHLGMFDGVVLSTHWYVPVVIGFFAGLVANGAYDIEAVRKVVKAIFGLLGIKVLPEQK